MTIIADRERSVAFVRYHFLLCFSTQQYQAIQPTTNLRKGTCWWKIKLWKTPKGKYIDTDARTNTGVLLYY